TAIAFSPDGSRFASAGGSEEPTIKLWDTVTGQEVWSLTGPKGRISKIAFGPNGQTLATCSNTGITFREVATGKELRTVRPEGKSQFVAVTFSPNWKTLAVSVMGGRSRSIKFRDLSEEKWLGTIPQSTVITTGLQFSPDGKMLALALQDGVSLWDV